MSKTVVLIPIHAEYAHPSYHLKSEYSEINFSEFNEKRNCDIREKETNDGNYHKVSLVTEYTVSLDESDYFCRFDIISPFESNKSKNDFTKEDFEKALNFHVNDVKDYINSLELDFPDGIKHNLNFQSMDTQKLSEMLVNHHNG